MTEVAVMRACSVPERIVEAVRSHVRQCPSCFRITVSGIDTRWCGVADLLIETLISHRLKTGDWP